MVSATSFMSITAIRVPPLQTQHFVGSPPRLVNSDLLSGCGVPGLGVIGEIMDLINKGVAFVGQLADDMIKEINSVMNDALSSMNTLIAQSTGAVQSAIQSAFNDVSAGIASFSGNVQGQINNFMAGVPGMASIMDQTKNLGLTTAGIEATFAPLLSGGFNAVMGPIMSVANSINSVVQTGLQAGAAAISSVIGGVTAGLNAVISTAMNAANDLINQMTSEVTNAVSKLVNLAGAAALSTICAGAKELNGFIDKIASPALKSVLPAPQ